MDNKKKNKKLHLLIIPLCLACILLIVSAFSGNRSLAEAGISADIISAPSGSGSQAALSSAIIPDNSEEIMGHKLVAENNNYQLYLYQPTLSIIVRDKQTGAIMETTVRDDDEKSNATWSGFIQSGISIELQEDVNQLQKKIDLVSHGADINVELVPGGFTAKVNYEKYMFGYVAEVLLYDDGSIVVSIPEESIYENSERFKIGNFYVYPFLGYTYLGEREGYMFVPDGNGALIYLNDKQGRFSEGYSQSVYGTDIGTHKSEVLSLLWDEYETHNPSELILAPIYGMVHTDSEMGYLAIIESGEQEATIEAIPNGAYTSYNWIGAKFRKTTVYKQLTSKSGGSQEKVTDRFPYDIRIRYVFVSGDNADYAGLANRYREYLIEKGELVEKNDEFRIRLDFMGSDVENWLLFKKNVTMTTTDNIREIYSELEQENVTQILSLYKGWQSGGIWDIPVKKYDAEGEIGGDKKLKNLMKDLSKNGISFYLYQDVLRINPDTSTAMFSTVEKLDKRRYSEGSYQDVYDEFNYLLPEKTLTNMNSLIKSFQKNNIINMAISGITNNLFSHMKDNVIYPRKDTMDKYENYIAAADSKMNLMLEQPIAPYWRYTEAIIDMPVQDSDYIYTEQSIPFLSIVLKGMIPMYSDYVNFEANKTENFLKLIETGIYPSFYLTYENPVDLIYTNSNDLYSSKYSVYKDMIVRYYTELKGFNDLVQNSYIIGHSVDNGITVVTYDNGIKVYINYGNADSSTDGIMVPAMSYKIGGAE